jgi:hypothetical protein
MDTGRQPDEIRQRNWKNKTDPTYRRKKRRHKKSYKE